MIFHRKTARWIVCVAAFVFGFLFFRLHGAQASVMSVSPSTGSFSVGSTFDVSVVLDTRGENINTISAGLQFPQDKLQLVSPVTTVSIITLWTNWPKFDNLTGKIELQGGIPGGIRVSNGLVAKFTFRVKSTGNAVIRFLDSSRVLLHDGHGTDALTDTQSGVFQLVLPPPAGPAVASDTHIDQGTWYANANAHLTWGGIDEAVQGYSYMLSDKPVEVPDDISEGVRTSVAYQNLASGIHYFHIKALRDGVWGGVTHFALNIDVTPPAEFNIEITPGTRTTRSRPVIQFATTDNLSGIDHYELKMVPLSKSAYIEGIDEGKYIFVEAQSPYVTPQLNVGSYDVIVRAYDFAGNHQEVIQRLKIVTAIFSIVGNKGIELRSWVVIPWSVAWIILAIILILLMIIAWRVRQRHHRVHQARAQRQLPSHVQQQLDELQRYRNRFGTMILLLALVTSLVFGHSALAQEAQLDPPYITTVSENISNEEIFYISGRVDQVDAEIVIYIQNIDTGQTQTLSAAPDKKGEWFYRHNAFLPSGRYVLWAQTRLGEQVSAPTAQATLTVASTAIQFGANRISLETLYLTILIIFAVLSAILIAYILFHGYHARRKHAAFSKEVKEAEESIRRGFAVLRRDIQAELAIIHQVKLGKALSDEEQRREEQLLKDLEWAERMIGKEIWDVENVERA